MTPEKFWNFPPHLETVFPPLKLTQSCYVNMNISFSWKVAIQPKIGSPLSSTNKLCLKEYPHNLTKYEINGTSKIPTSQLFSELGKIWKYSLGLYSKSPVRATFRNPKTSFWIGRNLEAQPKTNTQKISFLNIWMNWETCVLI